MSKWFFWLYHKIEDRQKLSLFVFVLIIGMLVFLTSQLKFQEDIQQLIPSSKSSEQYQRILETVEFTDKIIVNISAEESGQEDQLVKYAEEFITTIQNSSESVSIEKIQGKLKENDLQETYTFIVQNLPLFLNNSDYETIKTRLPKDSIQVRLDADYKSLIAPSGFLTKDFILKDPLQFSTLGLSKLKDLQLESGFNIYQNFLLSNNNKNLLLLITPSQLVKGIEEQSNLVDFLNKTTEELNEKHRLKSSLFGSIFYTVANANQIKQDIALTVGIAVLVLMGILIFFYKKLYLPLILLLPTLVGALFALAIIYLLQGEVSLISLGIGSILIGISLDYSLHILTHFRANANPKKLYKEITKPILTSSVTTAVAFFCLLFLNTKALADLGLFAGLTSIFSAISALLVIPHLFKGKNVVRFLDEKRNGESLGYAELDSASHLREDTTLIIVQNDELEINSDKSKISNNTFLDRIGAYDYSNNKILLGIVGAFFLVGIFFVPKVEFNEDLSQLNYQPENLVEAEQKLNQLQGKDAKNIYLVSYGNTLNDALTTNQELFEKLKKFKENNSISSFSSIGGVVLSTNQQEKKYDTWRMFWTDNRKDSVQHHIQNASLSLGLKPKAFQGFYNLIEKDFSPINLNDYQKVANLYLEDFIQQSEDGELFTITSAIKISAENLEGMVEMFKQQQGILVLVRQQMNQSFLGTLKDNFNQLILYSFIVVFVILLLAFKDIKLTLITLIPIAVTWVIALFFMVILNIHFNVLNIIISTFIFGLGIDYSIFITTGLNERLKFSNDVLKTYKTSILLSVITTLLGMSVLIFAQHPALKSIAGVSLIGILSAVLVSFTIQPYLFRLMFKKSN